MKRLFDFLASAAGLLILSPIFAFLAIWIRLDSPGPAFFRQKRVGWKGVPFYVLKFRTMAHRNPEKIDQKKEKVIAKESDMRITKAGRFLRKSSLDELPQLINILKGEMSLVGPRPVLPEQLDVVPHWFAGRFQVRPGITGLAQVRGRRSLSWEQQLQYDLQYAENQRFWRDIGLLIETATAVATARGIYGEESKNWRAYRKEWAPHALGMAFMQERSGKSPGMPNADPGETNPKETAT